MKDTATIERSVFPDNCETRRIIIIDDNDDYARGLAELLDINGFTTRVTNNIEQTLVSVEEFLPNVALIDLQLGQSSGLDLVLELNQKEILCIIITANANLESVMRALREGAYNYLQKPVRTNILLAELERCFDKIQLQRDKLDALFKLQQSEAQLRCIVDLSVRPGVLLEYDHDGAALRETASHLGTGSRAADHRNAMGGRRRSFDGHWRHGDSSGLVCNPDRRQLRASDSVPPTTRLGTVGP